MLGVLLLSVVLASATSWTCVYLLLRRLREHHSQVFVAELGAPTWRQLLIVTNANFLLQCRFLKFIWFGHFLKLRDEPVTAAGIALIACTGLGAAAICLLFSGV